MPKGHRGNGGYVGASNSTIGVARISQQKDLPYETLTFVTSGGCVVLGNGTTVAHIYKTSGNDDNWNGQAYSVQSFTAPATIEFNKTASAADDGNSYAMIGFNTDPTTDASYSSIDHAAYPYKTNNWARYNNGAGDEGLAAWNASLKNYVVFGTDSTIKHYNGSTLLYTGTGYSSSNTVYVDSSLYKVNKANCSFNNVRVIKRTWNGTQYV